MAKKNLSPHYNFPLFRAKPGRCPSPAAAKSARRPAERALIPVTSRQEGSLRDAASSDASASNGSTSMGSSAGKHLALMVPWRSMLRNAAPPWADQGW